MDTPNLARAQVPEHGKDKATAMIYRNAMLGHTGCGAAARDPSERGQRETGERILQVVDQ